MKVKPGYFPLYKISAVVIAPNEYTDDQCESLSDQLEDAHGKAMGALKTLVAEIDPRLELEDSD